METCGIFWNVEPARTLEDRPRPADISSECRGDFEALSDYVSDGFH